MPTLTWAHSISSEPMGAERYEVQVQAALAALPEAHDWDFRHARVIPLRAQGFNDIEGLRRVPDRLLHSSSGLSARLAARAAYPRGLVHRFDLRLPPAGAREVTTIHGLEPWHYPDEGGRPAWLVPAARRSYGAIVPSEFTAGEVRERLGITRVWVIPHGLAPQWDKPQPLDADLLRGLGIDRPFVLHAAGASQRKNLPALAEAWPEIHSRTGAQLVLCGAASGLRNELFGDLPGTRLVGRQPDEVLVGLMAAAAAVVVPSLYEGFGLPALEAMACGTPVVASRRAALPEVCGEAALLVEPTPIGLAGGLVEVLTMPGLAERLGSLGRFRASGFSWRSAALSHLDVYEELALARAVHA